MYHLVIYSLHLKQLTGYKLGLEISSRSYRLFIQEGFDSYLLWPFGRKLIFAIVAWFTVHNFTVVSLKLHNSLEEKNSQAVCKLGVHRKRDHGYKWPIWGMKSRDSLQGKQQKTKAGSASSQRSPSVVLVVGQSEHKLSVFSQVLLLSASQAFIFQKYVACTKKLPSNSPFRCS